MNIDWARKHTELLRRMREMDLSKSSILRIIDVVNALLDDPTACMVKTDEFTALLKSCKTEEEVLAKLDEAGV